MSLCHGFSCKDQVINLLKSRVGIFFRICFFSLPKAYIFSFDFF